MKLKSTTTIRNIIYHAMKKKDWHILCRVLEFEFKIVQDKSTNKPVLYTYDKQNICLFHELLLFIKDAIVDSSEPCENAYLLSVHIFKALRNYCLHHGAHEAILKDALILITTEKILAKYITKTFSTKLDFIRFLVEFLTNMCVVSQECKLYLYNIFKNHMTNCIKFTCSMSGCAFVYNLLLNINADIEINRKLYDVVLNSITSQTDFNDYLQLLISYVFVKQVNFCKFYMELNLEKKLIVVKNIKFHHIVNSCSELIHVDLFSILMREFQESSSCILVTANDCTDNVDNAIQVVLLLEIIASFASNEPYLICIQQDTHLLITCCTLLQTIHECGKMSKNYFTPLEKLSDITQQKKEIEDHPAFGFKANLIRVLGIFAYKHQKNQEILNQYSAIPLILDCCILDGRNPFIMQCAILAVRNLCENNQNNQAVIASLSQRGMVKSEILEELGVSLHISDKNKLNIVSLDSLKSE